MKINTGIDYKSIRETRNIIAQLKKNNSYSLTENNARRINTAIETLSEHSGESNTKFLINTAKELKYGTNITLGKESRYNWRSKLHEAAKKSFEQSDDATKEKLAPEIDKMLKPAAKLSGHEEMILKSRDSILSRLDMEQLKDEKNPNIRNVKSNLDYFIASSEVSIKEKSSILKKLDFLLSPNYNINPQLKNKRTKVFAELINDLVVNTPESKIPNTKAINQKHHGMCAAISISRKMMSYEEKSKYVDTIMSELDDTPHIMVFDKMNLGSGKRVPVQKAYVDFEDAEKKGYRIIDASTTQWMNIADMYGASNTAKNFYTPFDAENFDAMTDNHRMYLIENVNLRYKHAAYQAMINSKEKLEEVKAIKIRKVLNSKNLLSKTDSLTKELIQINSSLGNELKNAIPNMTEKQVHSLSNDLFGLNQKTSLDIEKMPDNIRKYAYIHNEENKIKDQKIVNYIKSKYPNTNSEQLGKKASFIRNLVDDSVSVQRQINPAHTESGTIARARKFYEAASSYNYQKNTLLKDNDYVNQKMREYNIPDKASLVYRNIDELVNVLASNNNRQVTSHFENLYNTKNKNSIIKNLQVYKDSIQASLTDGMDTVFYHIGVGDRQTLLKNEIMTDISSIKNNKMPEHIMRDMAMSMGVKPDKKHMIKRLEKYNNVLSNNPSEENYTHIFNKLGHKDPIEYMLYVYNGVAKILQKEDDSAILYFEKLKQLNDLPPETDLDTVAESFNKIGDLIDRFDEHFKNISESLVIYSPEGKLINSPKPEHAVKQIMIKRHEIFADSELEPLKNRFDSIDKLRSQDEFSSRQGKISDPSLYKFSPKEKETLKKISKNINSMYSETRQDIARLMSTIREPLEEHVRKLGIASGDWWNEQIHRGLGTGQQLKILEMLTDRSYKKSSNLKKSVEKIKNSPYSGISTTSVFHDRIGMHAQYIEEISPSSKNGKDILYHDNTWGACELENTWTDSEGLTRTDYSDNRGGELGYITGNKFLNGNYVENLLYKGGKTVGRSEENKFLKRLNSKEGGYKFPLMSDILLPGQDGAAKDVASQIYEGLFHDDMTKIDNFEKILKKMTKKEIEAGIKRGKTAATGYQKAINQIDSRIFGSKFTKGINTEEEYKNLADNDPVRLTFEKAALLMEYPDGVEWKKLATVKTVKDLNGIKNNRDKIAQSYFNYAFGKDNDVLNYYETVLKNNSETIFKPLKEHGIKIEDDAKLDVIQRSVSLNLLDIKNLNGSAKNNIDYVTDEILKNLLKKIPPSKKLDIATKQIKKNATQVLKDSVYINPKDVNNTSTKFTAIKKYIDRKYQPGTDEEFIKQYRRLQDMTTEEFNTETTDATIEDLGIQNLNGYELLKQYKASNSTVKNKVHNIVYQNMLLDDIKLGTTRPAYTYNKLYKSEYGAFYESRPFDDYYRSISNNLTNLELSKIFNEVKDDALRKYGMIPAYPKISVISENAIDATKNSIGESIEDSLDKINSHTSLLREYRLMDKLCKCIEHLPDNPSPSSKQADKIKTFANEFISQNYGDKSVTKSIDAAQEIINLDKTAKGTDYKKAIAPLKEEMESYKKLNPPETIKAAIQLNMNIIKEMGHSAINIGILPRKTSEMHRIFKDMIRKSFTSNSHYVDTKIDAMSDRIDNYSLKKRNHRIVKEDFVDTLESELYKLISINNGIVMNTRTVPILDNHVKTFMKSVLTGSDSGIEELAQKLIDSVKIDKPLQKDTVHQTVTNTLSSIFNTTSERIEKLPNYNKMIEDLTLLNTTHRAADMLDENKTKIINKINKTANTFVAGNIKKEYQESILQNVNELVYIANKPFFDKKQEAEEAKELFYQGFKNNHILNDPQAMFKEYMLIHAKDAGENPDGKLTTFQKQKRNTYRQLLKSTEAVASQVDVQAALMDIENEASPNLVVKKLLAHKSPLEDPTTHKELPLSNPKAIDYMVKKMIVGENDETAMLFIEKLGFAKQFIDAQNEIINFDSAKELIDNMVNSVGNINLQANTLQKELEPLIQNDNVDVHTYLRMIDKLKKSILEKSKNLKDNKVTKQYISGLNEAKKIIKANPQIPKGALIEQCISEVNDNISELLKNDINNCQSALNTIHYTHKMVNKLNIPKHDVETQKALNEFNTKYDKFLEYNNDSLIQASKDNPNMTIKHV